MDETLTGWRAYYFNGEEFSSETTPWSMLPDDGVAIVIVYLTGHRIILSGDDWYFLWVAPDGEAVLCSNRELLHENQRRYPGAIFKRGQWTSHGMMQRMNQRALAAKPCGGCS